MKIELPTPPMLRAKTAAKHPIPPPTIVPIPRLKPFPSVAPVHVDQIEQSTSDSSLFQRHLLITICFFFLTIYLEKIKNRKGIVLVKVPAENSKMTITVMIAHIAFSPTCSNRGFKMYRSETKTREIPTLMLWIIFLVSWSLFMRLLSLI